MSTTTIYQGSHLTTTSTVTASCTTAVPGTYGYVPFDPNTCNFNYHFYPSFTGNLAFATIFGLSTIVHLIEAIAFKKDTSGASLQQRPIEGFNIGDVGGITSHRGSNGLSLN
ncbi:hypothetical protein FOXB_17562 [Fusarium oxysporum f. sp. conglutinans Fo5176]|uniref:Uncharacterized protein n=1 Tax=Fusarium oxysporum (strain Fo5176) TaxID=660025 RepID=F9GFX8_FUSOF|nr:hypothetical protein FOXB_17562 [Fusarium oxysporum f. sp. conglutinans Fo5176]